MAAWDARFAYRQWRPITAIRAAGEDGNASTAPLPSWTPLLETPPFPDYVAGHTAYAGAAEVVLAHVFGAHPGVELRLESRAAPGVVLAYATWGEMAKAVVEARILGGIHWRTSSEAGRALGARIGAYALEHALEPRDAPGRP